MQTRKFYCESSSTVYVTNMVLTLVAAIVGIFGIVLLIDPWLLAVIDLDFEPVTIIIIAFVIFWAFWYSLMSFKTWRKLAKVPTLEIEEDDIIVSQGDSNTMVYKFREIEKFELSTYKILGKEIRCINVIPFKESYDTIASRPRKNVDRARIQNYYKRYGAVCQIYEHLVNQPIDIVLESLQKQLDEFRQQTKNQ